MTDTTLDSGSSPHPTSARPAAAPAAPATAPSPSGLSRALREPLLHFALLGAAIFGIDAALATREGDPNAIKLTQAADAEIRSIFSSARGREPNADELRVLRERWLDNEVLYREGLALQLDKGDEAIRDRVIFKSLNVVQANLALPKIDEAGLRQWFENNRALFDMPARVDFLEAAIAGKPSEAQVADFVRALNGGREPELQSGLRVFKNRPVPTVVEAFGPEFSAALEKLPIGEWQVLPSKDGPRAVRVQARVPMQPANFDTVAAEVVQEWRDRQMQQLRTDGVRQLAKKYTLVIEGETK